MLPAASQEVTCPQAWAHGTEGGAHALGTEAGDKAFEESTSAAAQGPHLRPCHHPKRPRNTEKRGLPAGN